MSTDAELELENRETEEEDPPPRELESALLSVALFGGMILFAVSCTMFGWN